MARFSFKQAAKELRNSARSPKRVLLIGFAAILFAFGVIGTFIPFVPARIIAAPSLILFSIYSPTVYAFLKRKSDGHPKIQSWLDRARNWLIRRIH